MTQVTQATQQQKRKDRSGDYSCVASVALDENGRMTRLSIRVQDAAKQETIFSVSATVVLIR